MDLLLYYLQLLLGIVAIRPYGLQTLRYLLSISWKVLSYNYMYVITFKNHMWYLKSNLTFPFEAGSYSLHCSRTHVLAQASPDSQSSYLYLP